jgi:hypothetical protein
MRMLSERPEGARQRGGDGRGAGARGGAGLAGGLPRGSPPAKAGAARAEVSRGGGQRGAPCHRCVVGRVGSVRGEVLRRWPGSGRQRGPGGLLPDSVGRCGGFRRHLGLSRSRGSGSPGRGAVVYAAAQPDTAGCQGTVSSQWQVALNGGGWVVTDLDGEACAEVNGYMFKGMCHQPSIRRSVAATPPTPRPCREFDADDTWLNPGSTPPSPPPSPEGRGGWPLRGRTGADFHPTWEEG